MFDIHRKSIQFGQETLTIETGRIARQADGAVLVTYGETMVLVTAVAEKKVRAGMDFFPLGVHYQEKTWAAGRIPGGFIKRETRPSEREILTSRLIDRPLRPLFPKNFLNDTQVIATVVSYDQTNSSDIPALIGASAALAISGMPFQGPIGGARVGFVDGKYVINPTVEQIAESKLDLIVAGTADAVTMVESGADFLSEEEMLGAIQAGFESFQPVIAAINELANDVGTAAWDVPELTEDEVLKAELKEKFQDRIVEAYSHSDKMSRQSALREVRTEAQKLVRDENGDETRPGQIMAVNGLCKKMEAGILRDKVLTEGRRIDGRSLVDVRPIDCQVGILPRVHGTALFTRGETQALVAITLGTGRDEQIVEDMNGERRDNFYLNYTFPPYCVGETGRIGAPKRREIGHGRLATRSLLPVVPTKEEFCYTMRVVSEVTESNGSSSMATVCGSSLALMDAGVPLKAPVAGIAMGMIKEGDRVAILSDILGDEDHLGDMDFKVAGNADGITALQMDIKIKGITSEIMAIALKQARDGRLHILGEMKKALEKPRDEMSSHAPRILSIKIHPDKIRDIIGPGGKVIRKITEETGCQIDVEDDGTVRIASSDNESAQNALNTVKQIVAEVEKGQIYEGEVVRVTDFGAFVNLLPKKDGLVHISQLANHRVQKVTDVVKEGDVVKVKVLDIDRQGRVKLTMKDVDK
ncbi:MAG: polyribonucleotide nucleotidyltransferase [Magnetococcales bacterium]|nr:polyribonucleotide nucleotidyltransferase [Magnetococcales bacterium]